MKWNLKKMNKQIKVENLMDYINRRIKENKGNREVLRELLYIKADLEVLQDDK